MRMLGIISFVHLVFNYSLRAPLRIATELGDRVKDQYCSGFWFRQFFRCYTVCVHCIAKANVKQARTAMAQAAALGMQQPVTVKPPSPARPPAAAKPDNPAPAPSPVETAESRAQRTKELLAKLTALAAGSSVADQAAAMPRRRLQTRKSS